MRDLQAVLASSGFRRRVNALAVEAVAKRWLVRELWWWWQDSVVILRRGKAEHPEEKEVGPYENKGWYTAITARVHIRPRSMSIAPYVFKLCALHFAPQADLIPRQ